jgi:hypothetical protein
MALTGGREKERERRSALRKTCPSANLSTTNEGLSNPPIRVSLSCFVNCSSSRESIILFETTRGFRMLKRARNKNQLQVRLLKHPLRINCMKHRRDKVDQQKCPVFTTRAFITVFTTSPGTGHVITSQMYPGYTFTHFFMI